MELHLQWSDPGQWSHPGDRPAYRFLTPDVDSLYAEFLSAPGLALDNDGSPWAVPADTPWGTREFHARDPGGNVLQFYTPRPAAGGNDAEPGAAELGRSAERPDSGDLAKDV